MTISEATDLADCTAHELLALYRARKASPVEATRAVLARIDRLQPVLNAFCLRAPAEEALASAAASEARWSRGEPAGDLDGVPVSIKDLILVKGWPTLRGSRTVDPNRYSAVAPKAFTASAWLRNPVMASALFMRPSYTVSRIGGIGPKRLTPSAHPR